MPARLAAALLISALLIGGCNGDEPRFRGTRDEGPPTPCPERMAAIPDLPSCIDRYEAAIVDGSAAPATDQIPASGVSYDEASSACRAAGYRLCREDEWTRACSGETGRRYPYGDEYEPRRCNTAEATDDLSQIELRPSGSFERCATPEGVFDLSGNVAEWTSHRQLTSREIRGGDAHHGDSIVRCMANDRNFNDERSHRRGIGFRCCADRRG